MGGNIFKDTATSINLTDVEPITTAYIEHLGKIFPMKAEA